jgi:hypothetical protein
MSNTKLPMPIIKYELVKPKDDNDCKCAPHLNFENGSCIPLKILIKLANAYNEHCINTKINDNIKLYDNMELSQPEKYKLYLLYEIGKRFKGNQYEWIKHKSIEFLNEQDKEELEYNIFRPVGPKGKNTWLSTVDINFAVAQYENKYKDFKFLGAVPIDFADLDNLPFKTLNFNDLYKNGIKRIGVIFNLDEHYKSGSHWVSLFADLEKGQIYFSDSYALPPEKRIKDFISKIEVFLKNNRNITNPDVRYNKTRHQKGNSECGVYSINFILRLLKGKTFDHITKTRIPDNEINTCRIKYFRK